MPHQDTFSACIMWYISNIGGLNNRASSMHPFEPYINSNLGYDIHRSYFSTILNLCNAQWPVKTNILTILCDIFVLVNVLVIKPLLCMYIDNISTLTSDMPSLVYTATYVGQCVRSVFCHHIPPLRVYRRKCEPEPVLMVHYSWYR